MNVSEADEIDYLLDGIRNKYHATNIAMHDVHTVTELQHIARKIDERETDVKTMKKTRPDRIHGNQTENKQQTSTSTRERTE